MKPKKAKPVKRKFITNQPGKQNVDVVRDRRKTYRRKLYKPYGNPEVPLPPEPPIEPDPGVLGFSQDDPGLFSNGVITIDSAAPPPAVNPPIASGTFNPPDGNVGNGYVYETSGLFTGGAVVSYAMNGILPTGLSLNTSTGQISGTPTTEQTASGLSVTATNADGNDTTNVADIDIGPVLAPGDWLLERNFLDGPDGATSTEEYGAAFGDAFDSVPDGQAVGKLQYDDTPPLGPIVGGFASTVTTTTGSVNFGGSFSRRNSDGGEIRVGNNGEYWVRAYFYIPAAFRWHGTPGFTKFMRIQCAKSNGSNGGYLDLAAQWGSGSESMKMAFSEIVTLADSTLNGPVNTVQSVFTSPDFPEDQWFYLDWYVFASNDTEKAIMRLYYDGVLIQEFSAASMSGIGNGQGPITLGGADNTLRRVRIGDYYNGGAPGNDTFWIDGVVITDNNNPPSKLGSDGNLIIGAV